MHDEFVLRIGTNIQELAPSYRLTSFEKWDNQAIVQRFRGKEPYIVICASFAEIAIVNGAVQKMTEALQGVGKISSSLLEDVADDPGVFLNRTLAVNDNVIANPLVIQLANRPLIATKRKEQYSVWVIHTSVAGRSSRAQPRFKQVCMFAPGEDPNVVVFAVRKEEEKMMVIQYHVHGEQDLFDGLSIQKSEAVLVLGADQGNTKYLFCQLSLDHAHELVRQYGT